MQINQSLLDRLDNIDIPKEDTDYSYSNSVTNVLDSYGSNADQYAKDRETSRKIGVSTELVSESRDQAEGQALSNELITRLSASPKTSKWLENPENARISYDDVQVLTELEHGQDRSWYEVGSGAFKGLGDSMMIGMGKVLDQAQISLLEEKKKQINEVSEFKKMVTGNKVSDQVLDNKDQVISDIDSEIKSRIQNLEFADSMISNAMPENMTLIEEGIRGGAQMVADMVPGIAVSVATRGKINPTLGYLTSKTYLDSYGSARVAGKDHETSVSYASIDAALEYFLEKIPTKRLESIFGELSSGKLKTSIKRWFLEEAATEQITTLAQSLNAYAFDLDEELANAKTIDDVIQIQGKRQAVTFISTLAGGGSISASAKGIDYIANRKSRAIQKAFERSSNIVGSEQAQDYIDNVISLSQASITNGRDSETFADFMENISPDQKIYIDAQAIMDMESPPSGLLEQIDGSNGFVEMKMSEFASTIAKNDSDMAILRRHIKMKESHKTQAEMEEDTDSSYIRNILDKANDSESSLNEAIKIYKDIRSEIVKTGRQSVNTAGQSAHIIPALITTQYENMKDAGITNDDGSEISIKQLFDDMNLKVAGPGMFNDISKIALNQKSEQGVNVNQDFGDLSLKELRTDRNGNVVEITDKAQNLWEDSINRQNVVESLRICNG